MSYELNALLATADLLDVVAAEVPVAQVARLAQGLALIPMTERLHGVLNVPGDRTEPGFTRFPAGFGRRLEAWSQAGPIAYVEADFFGGAGTQQAAVWLHGRIELGPLRTEEGEPSPDEGTPISQALRRLGATVAQGRFDEFDAIGLGAQRRSADWLRG
ncbi:hypothetical protein [Kitasatospora sp. NPDC085879]|uniref:hypothetical protein n=1 Tax=Kitasatospora sp. NPDC085879 TaxID=3154769 RepID=UPI00342A3086